jgi:S1-C subfamily serine protease
MEAGMKFPLKFFITGAALLFVTTTAVKNLFADDTTAVKAGGATAPPPATEAATNTVENSVVKIFGTMRYPDYFEPWTKRAPSEVTGSGVVIEGKRILSNAHVVLYASQVLVQANQAGEKIPATVEAIAPGIDLAVLKLEDESFFDKHPPLARASTLPEIKDPVLAYGYPKGGNSLSITKGIVSRIEFVSYNFPVSGLRIQIDAAINPGNSGGPAVAGDKMIGLAFSHLRESENIGYIIPCEEIELFLKGIADGHYDGKPAMFDVLQTLENPALHSFLKVDKGVEGIVVHRPDSSDPDYPLKEWDIITRIGGMAVDNEGMIKIKPDLRVRFEYRIQTIAKNGTVPLTVVRSGKELNIELPVSAKRALLTPPLNGTYPRYFICGPLVFSTCSMELANGLAGGYQKDWTSSMIMQRSPIITRYMDKQAFDGEEQVMISSPFFPHKLAKGYSSSALKVVRKVGDVRIKNLKHLVEVLRDSQDTYVTVKFEEEYGESLVFPRAELLASTEEILTDNGVRSQGSPDMLAVWNAKPAR